ncbi:MAG: carboxypeptidase M32 [Armatimonadota bacterium]|nr:carboxypeptidase M32 [bacterium]
MSTEQELKLFYDTLSELYRLECIAALLGWDQQVYMPANAAKGRAGQAEYIARLLHQKMTDPKFAQTVDHLYEQIDTLSDADRVNVREIKRMLDIQRKLPEDFVSEMTRVETMAYSEWVKARRANDFDAIKPLLKKLVELCRKKCDLIGYKEHPYDALLDLYDPGSTLSFVKPLLLNLAGQLRDIIPPISKNFEAQKPLCGRYDISVQDKLCRRVAQDMGFDFQSGRFDTTPHPFMTTIGPSDLRITTRYDESDFIFSLYSTIHETGHALYEQGLPTEWAGTPMGSAVSLSIHESQSRMWENLIGRSKAFCIYLSKVVKEFFPDESMDADKLWNVVNRVGPSLIRTEADEVTYSQHIVIRMLLEEQLITGELTVSDLPGAWNDMYENYLGIRPTDYKDGVMQDVHWYSGSIGYFPTYALGNLYNAMMMEAAKTDMPDMADKIERGEFGDMLDWLRGKVHKRGMQLRGRELIRDITGRDLSAQPFVDYLKRKFLAE